MRIALLVGFYEPAFRGGGPIRTAVAMVTEYGTRHQFLVLTSNADWGVTTPLSVPSERWTDLGKARVWYAHRNSVGSLFKGLQAVRRQNPDVVYLNSVLDWRFAILPVILARMGYFRSARVLIAPRGELDPGALSIKSAKKRAFLAVARAIGLHQNLAWHASSEREAADIKAIYPRARVIVKEDEVLLPSQALDPSPSLPAEADTAESALRVVFLSRLVPNKGLHTLLSALATVRAPVALTVVGEGPDSYVTHCVKLAHALPPSVTVHFAGPVHPEDVTEYFESAELFAYPTTHENFGHVIAEALAVSCPVLSADVTPWTPVIASGGGAVVESLDPWSWGRAIEDWAAKDPAERLESRRAAGRAYSEWRSSREPLSVFDLAFHATSNYTSP